MKASMKYVGVFLAFLFLVAHVFGQDEYAVSMSKSIKIASNDTIILASVSRTSLPKNKVEKYKRYYWFSKGSIQSNIGGYHGNLLHGDFELFKDEKLIVEGTYENGLKEGLWKVWDANGKYIETASWKEGVLKGEQTVFYKSGLKKSIANYKNGLKNGRYFIFDEKGALNETGKYKEGLKRGKVVLIENGVKRTEKYKGGVLVTPETKKEKDKTQQKDKDESSFSTKLNMLFKKEKGKVKDEKANKERFVKIKEWFKAKE